MCENHGQQHQVFFPQTQQNINKHCKVGLLSLDKDLHTQSIFNWKSICMHAPFKTFFLSLDFPDNVDPISFTVSGCIAEGPGKGSVDYEVVWMSSRRESSEHQDRSPRNEPVPTGTFLTSTSWKIRKMANFLCGFLVDVAVCEFSMCSSTFLH